MGKLNWIKWGLGALALGFAVAHAAAIYTESINWDELAVFHRAQASLREGRLFGGGRPGLGALISLPLVRQCSDAIAVVHTARAVTAVVTLAFLVGFFLLLRSVVQKDRDEPGLDAAFGVALLVCVPVFLRWSLQVRTDQWALACGVWGGLLVIGSARRTWLAVAAGALYACGYLFTQKLVYVLALTLLLVASKHILEGARVQRRDALRVAGAALGGAVVLGAYYLGALGGFKPAYGTERHIDSALRSFDFYREFLGYRVYTAMLGTLGPHLVVGLLLVLATLRARLSKKTRELALAWAVLALGLTIGVFHAGAFPYFWMTLGMFPAAAAVLALGPLRELVSHARLQALTFCALWLMLILPATVVSNLLLRDTQKIQRDALAFVERNFPAPAQGFHPEGGLFCRKEPDPLPVYFTAQIAARLTEPAAQRAFIEDFKRRPVMFLVDSYRLANFPPLVLGFWDAHYVAYGPRVLVPGFYLPFAGATQRSIEVVVPGTYRLVTEPAGGSARVDTQLLRDGETIALATGEHQLAGASTFTALAYAVKDAPDLRAEPFYASDARAEFEGLPQGE